MQRLDGRLRRAEVAVLDKAASLVHARAPVAEDDNLYYLTKLLEDLPDALLLERLGDLPHEELYHLTRAGGSGGG